MKKEVIDILDEITQEETQQESFRELLRFLTESERKSRKERVWKDSVESPPQLKFDLSQLDLEEKVLYYALRSGRLPILRIPELIDRKRQWAYDTVHDLEEKEWISLEDGSGGQVIRVEPAGFKKLAETPAVEIAENGEISDEAPYIRVHNVKLRYKIPESAAYSEYERSRIMEKADWGWEKIAERDAYLTELERVNVILNPESMEVHLNKSYIGMPESVTEEIMEDVREVLLDLDRTMLDDETIYSEFNFSKFKIFQAEIAVRNLPPIVMIQDAIESLDELDFNELEHRIRSGQRIWIDYSPTGEKSGEIETEGFRFIDQVREYVKLQFDMFENPLAWREIPQDIMDVKNEASRNTEFLRELNDLTSEYFQTSSNE